MDVQKFREVIERIKATHIENYYIKEQCWQEEIRLLSENVASTIEYLKNECTADEFGWISDVIDEVAAKTQSRELVECYKKLGEKFPDEAKTFRFDIVVQYAEGALEDSHAKN